MAALIVICGLLSMGECLDVLSVLPPEALNVQAREQLNDADLQALLSEWDNAKEKGLCETRRLMLPKVALRDYDNDCCWPYYVLRYKNPEIVERMVNLYVGHHQAQLGRIVQAGEHTDESAYPAKDLERYRANLAWHTLLLNNSLKEHGRCYSDGDVQEVAAWERADDEFGQSRELASLAESTFSESIYDLVWGNTLTGNWKMVYLVNVLPDKTVECLLNATLGVRLGRKLETGQDLLCRQDNGLTLDVSDAFRVLSEIARTRPEVLKVKGDELAQFVRKHGRHYWENRTGGRYSEFGDYVTRLYSLDILEALGDSANIPIAEDLARDAPPNDKAIRVSAKRDCKPPTPVLSERAEQVISALRQSGS